MLKKRPSERPKKLKAKIFISKSHIHQSYLITDYHHFMFSSEKCYDMLTSLRAP